MNNRFPSSEKLKSRKAIERLFTEGKTYKKFPVKVFYIPSEEITSTQATFAVPKRNFKNAVDRNRIKRLLREAYRLHKQLLIEEQEQNFTLLFLYLSKEEMSFQAIEKAVISLLKQIKE